MQIVQIIPNLPPSLCGIKDYALLLSSEFEVKYKIQSVFISPNCNGEPKIIEEKNYIELEKKDSLHLLSALEAHGDFDTIILHYVSFGYHPNGTPVWLLAALRSWKTRSSKRKIISIFHELYNLSAPWTRSFWFYFLQKRLIKDLALLSSSVATTRTDFSERLSQLGAKNILFFPVFSTIGEPSELILLKNKNRNLIFFGHPNTKKRAYLELTLKIEALCASLFIKNIIDIGKPSNAGIDKIGCIPIVERGVLSAEAVSEEFSSNAFALVTFPPVDQLGRSTVFAACCAHGTIAVVPDPSPTKKTINEGLEEAQHYLGLEKTIENKSEKIVSLQKYQRIAKQALSWYQPHCLAKQAEAIRNLIE